jgi:hypothetical protein
MATAPDAAPPTPSPRLRLRDGWLATLAILAAALVLLGLARTSVIAASDERDLFPFAAAVTALALPGPILRLWDVPGQILLWNAAGWCLGLLVMGLSSVGAQPMLPLIILLFALTFWPRTEGTPVLWVPGAVAFLGGAGACILAWEEIAPAIPLFG